MQLLTILKPLHILWWLWFSDNWEQNVVIRTEKKPANYERNYNLLIGTLDLHDCDYLTRTKLVSFPETFMF